MSENFWDLYDQEEAQNVGGGGGYICQVEFTVGYKVFVGGMSNEESWFAFAPGDAAAREAALDAARNTGGKPQYGMQFRVIKDSIIGDEVTWQGDRYETYPGWTDDGKLAKEQAQALNIAPGTHWCRFAWFPSPSGRMKKNEPDQPEFIGWPVEVYDDKAAAEAAAASIAENTETAEVPQWLPQHIESEWAKQVESNVLPEAAFRSKFILETAEALKSANISAAQVEAALGQLGA